MTQKGPEGLKWDLPYFPTRIGICTNNKSPTEQSVKLFKNPRITTDKNKKMILYINIIPFQNGIILITK